MSHAGFVHLRVRSAFSLLEGAVRYDELAKRCRAERMPAVAVTDSANLFGAMQFGAAAAKAGVQPIMGVLMPITPSEARPRAGARPPEPERLLLLVKDETGYGNLLRLMTRAYLGGEPGTAELTLEDLEGSTEGLIALTGGPGGPVGAALARGDAAAAEAALLALKELFGDRLYVELMRHGLEVEDRIEPALLDLAYAQGVPLVATNDIHFMDASFYEAHDVLLCIAQGLPVMLEERRRLTPEHRFKSAEEMQALFADLPEALENTLVIARRCAFKAPARRSDPAHLRRRRGGGDASPGGRGAGAAAREDRLDRGDGRGRAARGWRSPTASAWPMSWTSSRR